MATTKKVAEAITTYRIKPSGHSDPEFEIDVPSSWKVTFGPLSPGSKTYQGGNALRFYENETKQRACYVDVASFYDTAIPRRIVVKTVKSEDESDSLGNGKSQRTVAVALKEV